DTFQDLSTAVAIVSVLPLLMARLAVERTELQLVDAKLRLMGAAVEEANELILITSDDCRVKHANRAFCSATGRKAGELLDQLPDIFLSPESLPRVDDIRKVEKNQAWSGTLIHRRSDGTSFQAASAVVPLTTDSGEI